MKRLLFLITLLPLLLPAQNRLALVIGNGDYEGANSDLRTSVNDAQAMAKALRECGFTVIEKYNLNLAEMKKAIRDEFGVQLQGKETALFYYSGHGIRHKSSAYSAELTNYFIPTDLSPNASADDLPNEAIPMSMVIGQMKKSGTIQNILLLDACRSYPPAKGWFKGNGDTKAPIIGSSKDVGETNSEQEFFIGYATEEGSVAKVGVGNISPFTAAFVAQMPQPGKDIQEIFSATRKAVIAKYPEQKPYPENKLNNKFYFRPIAENQMEYDKLKPKCDAFFIARQWAKAEGCYELMQEYLPTDNYAKDKIALCEANLKKDTPTQPILTPEKKPIDIPVPEMVRVEGGTVKMSDTYSVTLSTYYIGKYEVTKGQFAAFVAETKYQTQDDKDGKGWVYDGKDWTEKDGITWRKNVKGDAEQPNDHPVMRVSYEDAQAYCAWLSKKTEQKYDLPSEAQWQFAAAGGSKSKSYTYSGSNDLKAVGWYDDNSENNTHPVGQKTQNELGLYDMSGNVWEWCKDWYKDYPSGTYTDRICEESGSYRVRRGGSWVYYSDYCASAYRNDGTPTGSGGYLGFRLSRTE